MALMKSYEALLQSGEAVYVENNTEPRGLLICTINDPVSGKPQKLEFPRTWIPFCLTDMLPREVLERSLELRRMFQKGLLRYVPTADAQRILATAEGQQEYERLNASEFAKGTRMTERRQGMIDQAYQSEQDVRSANALNPNVQYTEAQLHPRMKAWETRIGVGEMDGPAMVAELRIHAGEFSKQDFDYLLAGVFPQEVKDFASSALATGQIRQTSAASPLTGTGGKLPTENVSYEADWN